MVVCIGGKKLGEREQYTVVEVSESKKLTFWKIRMVCASVSIGTQLKSNSILKLKTYLNGKNIILI